MTDSVATLTPVPASEAPSPAPIAEDLTVLVVDDEPSNLASLRKIFERDQMRVFTAEQPFSYTVHGYTPFCCSYNFV